MRLDSGRLEKRTPLSVPVQIVGMGEGGWEESGVTENVCASGLRVLAGRQLKPSERLLIGWPSTNRLYLARVVYCEGIPKGGFAAGLRFEERSVWFKDRLVKIDDVGVSPWLR